MKFSIITPFRECGENIKQLEYCIQSLKEQTFTDFEVIFLHSGKEDVIDKLLSNSNIDYKLIDMPIDANLGDFRNRGIVESMGEYVLFLDADDYLHTNALIYASKMIEEEKINTNVFKLLIKPSNLDRKTTLDKIQKDFYKANIEEQLARFLSDNNNNYSVEDAKIMINKLFDSGILNHEYKKIDTKANYRQINFHYHVHGFIIKKEFLVQNNIYFNSEIPLYSDIPFLIDVYSYANVVNQAMARLYYKHIQNDPINTPSLSQQKHEDRHIQRIKAYSNAITKTNHENIIKRLKSDAAKYYLYNVVTSDTFGEGFNSLISIYQELNKLFNLNNIDFKIKKSHRFEINAIKNKKFKKAYLLSKSRSLSYNIYQFTQSKNTRFRQKTVQKNVFSKLPIKRNTVLYESFLGRNYSDSPKAIFKYLLDNEPNKWNHVWILNDKELVKDEPEFNHNNVKIIKRFGWKYFYYVTVSKYFVLNMRQPKWLIKKSEQIILSTWHGTPLKKLVFDMENVTSANKNYKRDFYNQSRNWDYLIAANEYSERIFESAFMYPKENILTYGYPRNDILSNHTLEYKESIKEKLGIPQGKKVILYAPTWRDDDFHAVGQYKFSLQLDLERLQREFGDEYVIVLRMHYLVSDNINLSAYEGFVFDYSKYNDINDLYIASDILITDYSSVFFDFAILRKPIVFYMYDLEKYQNVLRGFYIDVNKELPGPILKTNDEVVNAIKNIDDINEEYTDSYDKFTSVYSSLEDGKASERVVKEVFHS